MTKHFCDRCKTQIGGNTRMCRAHAIEPRWEDEMRMELCERCFAQLEEFVYGKRDGDPHD